MRSKKIISCLLVGGLFSNLGFATDLSKLPVDANGSFSSVTAENDSKLFIISNRHVNKIVTPFENPVIAMDSVEGVQYQSQGSVLFLSANDAWDSPIAAWVFEEGDEESAIGISLKAMDVPSKEVLIRSKNRGSAKARKFETSNPRNNVLLEVSKSLALGDMPFGYSSIPLNAAYFPDCNQSGLSFDFTKGQMYSGWNYVVSVGVVENVSQTPVEFKENNCFSSNVASVAAYPIVQLKPNEKSEVYVTHYRATSTSKQQSRKSLLGEDK